MKIKELFVLLCLSFLLPACTTINTTYNYNNKSTSNLFTYAVLPTVKVNNNSGAGVVIKIVKGAFKDKVYILTAAHVLTAMKTTEKKIGFPPPKMLPTTQPTTQPAKTSIMPNESFSLMGEKDFIIISFTKKVDINETNIEFYVYDNNGKVREKVREKAKVIKRNKDIDFALLVVETRPNLAKVSRIAKVNPRIGDTLYSVGTAGIRAGTPVLTKGEHGGWYNHKKTQQGIYTGGTFFGDSGGPVYNDSFELVGIIIAVRNPAWHIGFYLNIINLNLLD